MLWKCYTQYASKFGNSAVATGLEKVSFYSNAKEFSDYHTIALISHAGKVMLKILQARLQKYMNRELPDVPDGFREGRGMRGQIANIHWIIKKAREFQKNIYFCFYWLCQSLWLCGSQHTVENSSRDGNTKQPDLPPEKSVCMTRSNSQNRAWNNRLIPSWERNMSRLYVVTLLI